MSRLKLGLLITLSAVLCGSGVAAGQVAHPGPIISARIPFPPTARTDANANTPTNAAADASNAFGFDLYAKLRSADGGNDNLFFSPYSLSSVLVMARTGTRGNTAEQMSTVLHLPANVKPVLDGFRALAGSLAGQPRQQGFALDIANALWGQNGEPFLIDYVATMKKDFGADLSAVDFAGQPEACRKRINDWVAGKTQGKIEDLLIPGSIDSQTRLVLTDAVYFEGKWSAPFNANQTTPGDFNRFAGQSAKAEMMHASNEFAYAEDDLCQAVRLPYGGDQLAMLILLPKIPHQADQDRAADPLRRGMDRLEDGLNASYLAKLTARFTNRRVRLTLPKWHATQAFDLGQTLADMGMKQAFSSGADFSGITGRPGLFLSDVVHKAFVAVDEQGTEAAAASGAVAPGAVVRPQAPVDFTADRPFVYMIVHVPSRTILFAGRLCDPSAGGQ